MTLVAVLGSNSFSGQDFVDLLLERGYHVLGVSRSVEKDPLFLSYRRRRDVSRFEFHQIDLNRDRPALFDLLAARRPEYVVNFAAQSEVAPSWEHPDQWFETNGVAVAALGDFMRRADWLEKYVHISSPEVYGSCEGVVREDAPLNPSTPYAASKAAGDLMLWTLVKNFRFPMTMIRATNVYGARQQLFKIIPRAVIRLRQGRVIELHGGGVAVKSYIHVRDVSTAELAALEGGRVGELYHVSPDVGVEVRDVLRRLCELMGRSFESSTRVVEERLGQDRAYVIDSAKLRGELGWKPTIGLDEGLRGVVRWVEECWDEIAVQPHEYVHRP